MTDTYADEYAEALHPRRYSADEPNSTHRSMIEAAHAVESQTVVA